MISKETQPRSLKIVDAEVVSKRAIDRFSVFEGTENGTPHFHSFFEMLYVQKGGIYHSVNAESPVFMQEGDFIFIDIGTVHEYTACSAVTIANLVFTPQLFNRDMEDCSSMAELFKSYKLNLEPLIVSFPVNTVMHDADKSVLRMMAFLRTKYENPGSLSGSIIRYSLISMLMHIAEPLCTGSRRLSNITEYLLKKTDTHYAEANLLSAAANELNYTVPHISAVFKNEFGIPFKEYLLMCRINNAKKLLRTTDMSVSDIGSAVGYSDIKFFRKLFKKHTNMTPRQYRSAPSEDYSVSH